MGGGEEDETEEFEYVEEWWRGVGLVGILFCADTVEWRG